MRISLIDRIGIGNAGAVENAGRDAAHRRREDEEIARLVAALSRLEAALPAGTAEPEPCLRRSQKAG